VADDEPHESPRRPTADNAWAQSITPRATGKSDALIPGRPAASGAGSLPCSIETPAAGMAWPFGGDTGLSMTVAFHYDPRRFSRLPDAGDRPVPQTAASWFSLQFSGGQSPECAGLGAWQARGEPASGQSHLRRAQYRLAMIRAGCQMQNVAAQAIHAAGTVTGARSLT